MESVRCTAAYGAQALASAGRGRELKSYNLQKSRSWLLEARYGFDDFLERCWRSSVLVMQSGSRTRTADACLGPPDRLRVLGSRTGIIVESNPCRDRRRFRRRVRARIPCRDLIKRNPDRGRTDAVVEIIGYCVWGGGGGDGWGSLCGGKNNHSLKTIGKSNTEYSRNPRSRKYSTPRHKISIITPIQI